MMYSKKRHNSLHLFAIADQIITHPREQHGTSHVLPANKLVVLE